jgi:hypothetical protein
MCGVTTRGWGFLAPFYKNIMTFNLHKCLKQSNTKDDQEDKDMIREEKCWHGYEQIGLKDKGDKKVPNCVKK